MLSRHVCRGGGLVDEHQPTYRHIQRRRGCASSARICSATPANLILKLVLCRPKHTEQRCI
jgi:hypothetical protein